MGEGVIGNFFFFMLVFRKREVEVFREVKGYGGFLSVFVF